MVRSSRGPDDSRGGMCWCSLGDVMQYVFYDRRGDLFNDRSIERPVLSRVCGGVSVVVDMAS